MNTTPIFLLLSVITMFGAGCSLVPGSTDNQQGVLGQRLPDHITKIFGTTLPAALKQAREDGRTSVRVTDPDGNIIEATVNSPTNTIFIVTRAPVDPYKALRDASVALIDKSYDRVSNEDGSWGFSLNVANHQEVASLIYEISVRVFNISSTTKWTIDIQ